MKIILFISVTFGLFFGTNAIFAQNGQVKDSKFTTVYSTSFTDAASFGFLPTETGVNNVKALQTAVDMHGTIVISKTGTYKLAGTVYIGDSTSLVFGNGVIVEKSGEKGRFTHLFLNKGALTRTWNNNITISGLDMRVNNVDLPMSTIYGLRGHVAFFLCQRFENRMLQMLGTGKWSVCTAYLHVRGFADLDNRVYKSVTAPSFEKGMNVLDSINWLMFQKDTIHTAVVKNVVFRDIFLYSPRIPFQMMSYSNKWAHSYYPGAQLPTQGPMSFENITMFSDNKKPLVQILTPCNVLNIRNSTLKENSVEFVHAADYDTYPKTYVCFTNCIFTSSGTLTLIRNNSKGKEIFLQTTGSVETGDGFSAKVERGPGTIHIHSDLTGLKTF